MCHDLLHLVLPLLKLKNNALEKPMQILHTAQKLPGVIRVGIPIRSFADLRIDEGEMIPPKNFRSSMPAIPTLSVRRSLEAPITSSEKVELIPSSRSAKGLQILTVGDAVLGRRTSSPTTAAIPPKDSPSPNGSENILLLVTFAEDDAIVMETGCAIAGKKVRPCEAPQDLALRARRDTGGEQGCRCAIHRSSAASRDLVEPFQ